MTRPDLSVVICTWNRAHLVAGALTALLAQNDAPPHEIIVVDNGSTDATSSVIKAFATHPRLRCLHEPRTGLAFARNTGAARARGAIVAFTDDDVRVPSRWLRTVATVLEAHPDAACAGGPVLPQWPTRVPRWLTTRQWPPLGIQDYGPHGLRVDMARPLCLIGANLAIRRTALTRVGLFAPAVQRVANGAGSTEDHDWLLRLWRCGGYGVYDPALRVDAVVPAERLHKRYHRAWHFGHGRHIARMRIADIEASRQILGVPGHVMRGAGAHLARWLSAAAQRDVVTAFEHEARLWFVAGFLRERWS